MTRYGEMSYTVTRGSKIADLAVTKEVQDEMKTVSEGTLDAKDGLHRIQDMIRLDMKTMKENGRAVEKLHEEYFSIMRDGKEQHVSRVWSGHRFTDREITVLDEGRDITFDAKGKSGDTYHVTESLVQKP